MPQEPTIMPDQEPTWPQLPPVDYSNSTPAIRLDELTRIIREALDILEDEPLFEEDHLADGQEHQ
jgi:hypothetical protein